MRNVKIKILRTELEAALPVYISYGDVTEIIRKKE